MLIQWSWELFSQDGILVRASRVTLALGPAGQEYDREWTAIVIVVLHGHDELGIRRRLEALREAADDGSGFIGTNLVLLDGRQVKAQDILGPATTAPFLAPQRLVIVEGLLGRFDPRGAQRGPRGDTFDPLLMRLADGLPESTTLVFVEGQLNQRRNPLLQRLTALPDVEVEFFPELKAGELLKFVREEAGRHGITFRAGRSVRPLPADEEWRRPKEVDPAQLLAALHSNTLALSTELAKLAVYTMDRDATVDDVDLLCGGERASAIWELIDGVLDGETARALQALRFQRSHGESVQGLLAQLAAAYRPLTTVLDLLDDGASPEEIGVAIRRPWPGLRDRAISRSQRLGREGLVRAFELLVTADRTIKLGEVRDEIALEVAVTYLLELSPQRGR